MRTAEQGITVMVGDITRLRVDAIVNAANSSLMGGGGVDGAIHRAGGPEILDQCREIRRTTHPGGLPTGQAVATGGGRLPARWVIHTVGPIYQQDPDPAGHLAACYRNCLTLARQLGATSVAFPGISTGVYGYPPREAAPIAVAAIRAFLAQAPEPPLAVTLVAFSPGAAALLAEALREG